MEAATPNTGQSIVFVLLKIEVEYIGENSMCSSFTVKCVFEIMYNFLAILPAAHSGVVQRSP